MRQKKKLQNDAKVAFRRNFGDQEKCEKEKHILQKNILLTNAIVNLHSAVK